MEKFLSKLIKTWTLISDDQNYVMEFFNNECLKGKFTSKNVPVPKEKKGEKVNLSSIYFFNVIWFRNWKYFEVFGLFRFYFLFISPLILHKFFQSITALRIILFQFLSILHQEVKIVLMATFPSSKLFFYQTGNTFSRPLL